MPKPTYSPALVLKLRKGGIVYPIRTIMAAKSAGLPLALACALLEQESSGGHNVFGHDPTIFIGAGEVTEAKYKAYKAKRGPQGQGGMQGVGPCQLTWYSIQDYADKLGGCWKPLVNMKVGFKILADNIRQSGLRAGVRAYNGSGAAAERYADQVLARYENWKKRLK